MKRVTIKELEVRLESLNTLLEFRKINKGYKIGFRNGCTYLDQKSLTHEHCIVGTSQCGTKREIHETINAICQVLQS